MKILNELVSIKIGKKQYDFNNLILDEYLKRFAKSQIDKDTTRRIDMDKKIRYCLVKFDTPFDNLEGSTELHNQDFDICFVSGAKVSQSLSDNQIVIQYDYETNENFNIWDYGKNTAIDNYINNYYGRKITAIGFNSYWINDSSYDTKVPVCAVLDTSNYNIYLQENQDFSVTRKDIIKSDALFYSNNIDKVPAPAHLCPDGLPQVVSQPVIYNNDHTMGVYYNEKGYGILYSVGLSSYKDYMDKEFKVNSDITMEFYGREINIKGLENYFFNDSLFCSENLYPSSDLYPIKSRYKYVIFKYKVWQIVHSGTIEEPVSTITDTGYYYYQAVPIEKLGKNDLKIKYERG